METSKHTPGPWRNSAHTFFGASDFPAVIDSSGHVVCGVIDDGKSGEETFANARLIAAAPELLEALTLLYRFTETIRVPVGRGKAQDAGLEIARAALAKATGATP